MSDTFNVTAAYDKAAYNAGDTITVTISGSDVLTTTTQATAGPLVVHIAAADTATQDITLPSVPVTITTTTPESVTIVGITDNGPTPRVWTIGASKVTGTATA
jgi:hypothetical protein